MDVKWGTITLVCFAFALDKELLQRITTEVRPYSKGRISRNQTVFGLSFKTGNSRIVRKLNEREVYKIKLTKLCFTNGRHPAN